LDPVARNFERSNELISQFILRLEIVKHELILAVSRVVRQCAFGTLAHESCHMPKENGVDH
jgi:hypothetical protein